MSEHHRWTQECSVPLKKEHDGMFDIDARALTVAKEIEDIYCQSFIGGRSQRLASIQIAIARAMTDIRAFVVNK